MDIIALSEEFKKKEERLEELKENMEILKVTDERKWLAHHGKSHLLDFQDEEIRKLRECFDSLDDDGSGSIGIEELEDPLIGLGFAESREEVKELVDSVDEDGSGMIEFPEFLGIIKNSDSNEKS